MTAESFKNGCVLVGSIFLALPLSAQNDSPAPMNDCTLAAQHYYVAEQLVKVAGDCDADQKPHGHWVFNYSTGKVGVEGSYDHGRKTGVWSVWNKEGVLLSETTYSDTTANYVVRTYWHDGKSPKSETMFDASGKWLVQTDWDVRGRRSSYPNVR